nr:MAG TPA: hypothetical protein [Caudoviricetes sp.]
MLSLCLPMLFTHFLFLFNFLYSALSAHCYF